MSSSSDQPSSDQPSSDQPSSGTSSTARPRIATSVGARSGTAASTSAASTGAASARTRSTVPGPTSHRPGSRPRPGPSLVVLAAVCWGTGGLAGSVLGTASGLSPVAVGSYRLLVAAVVLLGAALVLGAGPLAATVRGLRSRPADAVRVLGVGLGLALFQLCYFVAVRALGVSVATLLTLGLAPVLVTLGAGLLLGERGGPRLRVALPVALLGLVLLVGVVDLVAGPGATAAGEVGGASGGPGRVAGTVAACTSAAGYAAVTLLGRSLSARVAPAHVTTIGFGVAALAALPAGLVAGLAFAPGPTSVALVVYLGVVPTALAYGLFFAGLGRTASGTASVLTLVEPLTATLLAVLLLGERLTGVQTAGAVLLLAAVLVLSVPGPRPARGPGRGPGRGPRWRRHGLGRRRAGERDRGQVPGPGGVPTLGR